MSSREGLSNHPSTCSSSPYVAIRRPWGGSQDPWLLLQLHKSLSVRPWTVSLLSSWLQLPPMYTDDSVRLDDPWALSGSPSWPPSVEALGGRVPSLHQFPHLWVWARRCGVMECRMNIPASLGTAIQPGGMSRGWLDRRQVLEGWGLSKPGRVRSLATCLYCPGMGDESPVLPNSRCTSSLGWRIILRWASDPKSQVYRLWDLDGSVCFPI